MTDAGLWQRLQMSLGENPNNWGAGLGMAAQAVNPQGISGQLGGVGAALNQGALMDKRLKQQEAERKALLAALMGGRGGQGGQATTLAGVPSSGAVGEAGPQARFPGQPGSKLSDSTWPIWR
jgi:hypothetical protein